LLHLSCVLIACLDHVMHVCIFWYACWVSVNAKLAKAISCCVKYDKFKCQSQKNTYIRQFFTLCKNIKCVNKKMNTTHTIIYEILHIFPLFIYGSKWQLWVGAIILTCTKNNHNHYLIFWILDYKIIITINRFFK
jgi:prolipoprotein diacylglyceryltransferase